VARSGWKLDDFKSHVLDAIGKLNGFDKQVGARLISLLRYVDGDYRDLDAFKAMRSALGDSKCPLFYLAIHPACSLPWSKVLAVQVAPLMHASSSKNRWCVG
jgi:glucose-6-phosphate 1-dehydrogenase